MRMILAACLLLIACSDSQAGIFKRLRGKVIKPVARPAVVAAATPKIVCNGSTCTVVK